MNINDALLFVDGITPGYVLPGPSKLREVMDTLADEVRRQAAVIESMHEHMRVTAREHQATYASLSAELVEKAQEIERLLVAKTQPEPEPVATVPECEACFTPDACQIRGTCDHYSAERLRVAKTQHEPDPPNVPLERRSKASAPSGGWASRFRSETNAPRGHERKTMIDLQALLDGKSAQWQRERAETQMTLGKLIAALEAMPAGAEVTNLHTPRSYRGYYSDLAFERGEGTRPAADLLADCKAAMGQVFHGYKGGDFVMGALTPVWVASYGDCGPKLMTLYAGGNIETADDE